MSKTTSGQDRGGMYPPKRPPKMFSGYALPDIHSLKDSATWEDNSLEVTLSIKASSLTFTSSDPVSRSMESSRSLPRSRSSSVNVSERGLISGLAIMSLGSPGNDKTRIKNFTGNYKVEVFDKNENKYVPTYAGFGTHVNVRDPETKIVLSRTYAAEGKFTFTSHTAGEHTICLHSNSSAWYGGGQLRVHLDIQVGEHANNYQEIAIKDKLTELQLRVRQLLDQVEQITKEQNYQRYREERFRQTSESTNQRVLWWSVAQTIILVITGFWQMRHLKGFFEAKKLV